MSIFDDPGEELDWMEEALWDEGEEDEESSGRKPFFPRRRRSQAEKTSQQAVFTEKGRGKKENRGLKFLAFLEAAAILAVVWWWIKWLY